jgi:hypothetical protein
MINGMLLPAAVLLVPTYFFEPCGRGSLPNTVKLKLFLAIVIHKNNKPAENPYQTV